MMQLPVIRRAASLLVLATLLPATALAQGTPVLECGAVGVGGDLATFRGVRFELDRSFTAVEIHVEGTAAGVYTFDLELRRSMGYTDPVLVSVPVSATLTGTPSVRPYPAIRVDLPSRVAVSGTEFFTLKVTAFSGPGSMFWEVAGIGIFPCPDAIVTDENNVPMPTVRTSACGLRVFDGGAGPIGNNYCSAVPNSTGVPGAMGATGSVLAASNDLTLSATNLPPSQFGIFIVSRTQGFVPGAGGTSNGNICLGGLIGRFVGPGQILSTGAAGEFSLAVDLTAIPQGAGTVATVAGDIWQFQAWHRDSVALGSNFTDGLAIPFQ